MQLQQKLPPRYSGTCYKLSPEEVAAKKAANIPYTLRFRVRKGEVVFKDLIKGEQKFNAEHIGDFIIRRQDNTASFMFCNAIDDALMQVTHALRGEDHVTNTPRQLLILEALGLQAPQYGHFPIILGQDGAPLSKRNGSKSLDDVNKEGYAILAVNNYLARLGQHLDDNTVYALSELAQCFTLEKINHAPAHYDAMQLAYWQKEVMHRMPADDLVAQLKPYLTAIPAAKQMQFVKLVQPNLCFPQEVAAWVEIFSSNWQLPAYLQEKLVADKLVFKAAIDFLKQQGLLDNLLAEVKAISGLSGKKLFLPLRLALTSREDGPELNKIFNYLGHDLIIKRLEAVC